MTLRILLPVVFTLVFFQPASSLAQTLTQSEIQARFDEANKLFEQGLELAKDDEEGSKALFDECLVRYESIVENGGIENCQLYYNIGNAHYMRGKLGYAILNYRRALMLNPSHALTLKNLQVARAKVRTSTQTSSKTAALSRLIHWHKDLPQSWRLSLIQLIVFILGLTCLLNFQRLIEIARIKRWLFGLAVVAILSAFSLIVEHGTRSEMEGVIVEDSVIGRKGPHGYSYQESFTQPLSAGVEAQWLEDRDGWSLIQFTDERKTWVPRSAFQLISRKD